MDGTALGTLLLGVGGVAGAVVTWLGKHGETALAGYTNLTGDLQEERDRLDSKVTELSTRLAEQAALRAADQAELARLRGIITHLGGDPP